MANITHTIVTTYRSEGGSVTAMSEAIEGDTTVSISDALASSATNEYIVAIPFANMQGFCFAVSKGPGATANPSVTIKTNDSGSPDYQASITPTNGLFWTSNMGANPISDDIATIFMTETAGHAAQIEIRVLLNSED